MIEHREANNTCHDRGFSSMICFMGFFHSCLLQVLRSQPIPSGVTRAMWWNTLATTTYRPSTMGNAAQHPTKHPATHHPTFGESLQHQSHDKDDNTATIEPQPENPTVLDSSEFSTTEHGSSASNTADVGRLEDFVMVGTFFTDESIGLSPPATPDHTILNDVGKEQEIHQHIQPTMENSMTETKFEARRLLFESNKADKSAPTNAEEGEETIDFDSPFEDLLNSDDRTELSDAVAVGENVSPHHQVDEETIAASDEKQGHTPEADMDPSDDPQKPSAAKNSITYAIGDHVYQWCSLAGIPGVFQHHGIVIGVQPAGDETYLTIVDFSNVLPSTSGSNNNGKAVHENDPETNPTANSNESQEANEASMKSDEEDADKTHRASSVTSVATQESEGTDTSQDESRDCANPESASAEVEPSLQNKRKRRPFFVSSSPSSTSSAPMFSSSNSGAGRNHRAQPARQSNQRQPFFVSTPDSSSSSAEHMLSSSFPDSVRTYTISSRKWHKVVYQANLWQRHFWRSGTCTSVSSDPPGLVMARVFFLMQHRHLVPKYHVLQSNCECMAVWCKTGQWSTLQAMSLLSVAAASQVKQATTMAAIAASQQVTVPASGFMGMLGYTTQVSLVSTQPYLLPAIGIYGALTVAVPMLLLNQAQRAWKRTTDVLTQEFWNHAVKEPETFAECITYWSSRGSSEDDDSGRGAVELAVS